MRILVAHNSHKIAGGEQRVFESETALLENAGHTVIRYNVHNAAVDEMPSLALAANTIWSRQSHRELTELIDRHQPQVAHFHNIVPLISPSVFRAAKRRGVATVWTLHNYRLICPGMLLLRDGHVCEDCVSRRLALPAIRHRCYRDSRTATTVVTAMQTIHRAAGTFDRDVDRFLVPSDFAREKLIAGGLPADKLRTKGNFVLGNPAVGDGRWGGLLFVGRLSPEKGLHCLLDAWRNHHIDRPLRIVGDGPLAELVRQAADELPLVEYLGRRDEDEVTRLMGEAAATIVPSIWYETFGLVVIESFAVGTPVIGARIGALTELIDPGCNGLTFQPGDPADLARAIKELAALDQSVLRANARSSFEFQHTAARNLAQLEQVYRDLIAAPSSAPPGRITGDPTSTRRC